MKVPLLIALPLVGGFVAPQRSPKTTQRLRASVDDVLPQLRQLYDAGVAALPAQPFAGIALPDGIALPALPDGVALPAAFASLPARGAPGPILVGILVGVHHRAYHVAARVAGARGDAPHVPRDARFLLTHESLAGSFFVALALGEKLFLVANANEQILEIRRARLEQAGRALDLGRAALHLAQKIHLVHRAHHVPEQQTPHALALGRETNSRTVSVRENVDPSSSGTLELGVLDRLVHRVVLARARRVVRGEHVELTPRGRARLIRERLRRRREQGASLRHAGISVDARSRRKRFGNEARATRARLRWPLDASTRRRVDTCGG